MTASIDSIILLRHLSDERTFRTLSGKATSLASPTACERLIPKNLLREIRRPLYTPSGNRHATAVHPSVTTPTPPALNPRPAALASSTLSSRSIASALAPAEDPSVPTGSS